MFRRTGLALRILRELAGLSQADLARKAGIGKSQLSKYENGKEHPKFESLGRILSVLAVRPVIFFYTADLLERLARHEMPLESLIDSEAGELIAPSEREAYSRIIFDVASLFEAQIRERARAALRGL